MNSLVRYSETIKECELGSDKEREFGSEMAIANPTKQPGVVSLIRPLGPGLFFRKVLQQTWATREYLALRCDLSVLPPIRRAKFETTIRPFESTNFWGFDEEFPRVKKVDSIEVFHRIRWCRKGIKTLHIAPGPDGSPAYAQWLVTEREQHLLHAHHPDYYLTLSPGEVLLEGAYTFQKFRGFGIMADGMAQLLRIARDGGARVAYTYVGPDNVPSLRGCANVGFVLDHVRLNTRRFGTRSSAVQPPDESAIQMWKAATAPRPSVRPCLVSKPATERTIVSSRS